MNLSLTINKGLKTNVNSVCILLAYIALLQLIACKHTEKKNSHIQAITDPILQDSLFQLLTDLTTSTATFNKEKDSIAFLILPVEASCPSCRRKTIDSIDKYKAILDDNHFIILSGKSNTAIASVFSGLGKSFPIGRNIFIDSTNQSFIKDLIFTKPTIYYAYNKKVYEKVTIVPKTILTDLNIFFKSLRNEG